LNKGKAIRQIMEGTEFLVSSRTIDQEWDEEQQTLVTYNITWDISVQQDFENPHRDTWYKEIESIANILHQRKYEEDLRFKFSGLVGELQGARTNLWRTKSTYLLMGGTWRFDSKDFTLTPEQAARRIKEIYQQAWETLLWCRKHQCFSNQADRDGYLYCQECDWEESEEL
jgi:hypothetical protein